MPVDVIGQSPANQAKRASYQKICLIGLIGSVGCTVYCNAPRSLLWAAVRQAKGASALAVLPGPVPASGSLLPDV